MNETITVKVIAAFENMKLGEVVQVELTPRIKSIIAVGLLKVVEDGAGSGGQDSDSPRRKGKRKAGSVDRSAAGSEPSTGFGSGGYGAPEVVDPQ